MRIAVSLLLLLWLSVTLFPAGAAAGRLLRVSVKTAQLRATPAPFGKILTTPRYGEQVEELEVRDVWVRVRYNKTAGWMHASLLATKVTALSAGQGHVQSAASGEELTLAGKGFNSQVETAYRQQNQNLDYATVERMERLTVTPEQMSRFLAEGGVIPEGADHAR